MTPDDARLRIETELLDGAPAATSDELARRAAALLDLRAPLLSERDRARTLSGVVADLSGYGPLEAVLADPSVTEVMVNGPNAVWVERSGRLQRLQLDLDERTILRVVERIIAPLGLHLDRTCPMVDARLPDGSRLNAVIGPVALDGPCVTIRRFGAITFDLSHFGPPSLTQVLSEAVEARRNIVVSGGTGAGKTTFLNALCTLLPEGDRVITIEDAAELRLPGSHVVRLEARPASNEGAGAVTVRELVRNALRMRPDRLVIGEVRGGEALDMVQALNTGHGGSLTTVHANSAADALRRLEVMVLMAGIELPMTAVRQQLLSAIDLVVHVTRTEAGHRTVQQVCRVVDSTTGPQIQNIYAR